MAIEEFKQTLIKNYLVEVKDIEKVAYEFGTFTYTADTSSNSQSTFDFEDFDKPIDDVDIVYTTVRDAVADYEQIDKDEKSKVSKFDKEVDDKQYVEKSEIPTEATTEEETTISPTLSENESGPEKFVLPIRKFIDDSMEIMEAQENKNHMNGVNVKLL